MTHASDASANPGHPGRLILVGGIPVDLVFRVPRLPGSGEDVLGSRGQYFVGGGFIVLHAAAQVGVRSCFAGRLGTGPCAEMVRTALAEIGCTPLQPEIADQDSTLVLVLVEPDGERTFVTSDNPELNLDADDLARIVVGPDDIVYISGYEFTDATRIDTITRWLQRPGGDAAPVVCDLGPYGAEAGFDAVHDLADSLDWLCMNEVEAGRFTGHSNVRAALRRMMDAWPSLGIIVRLGADGAVLRMPGRDPVRVPALVVDEVVDTNGAGDTHTGTFCAALVRGRDPLAAVWLANCAAALSVTRFGSATAPPLADSDARPMPVPVEAW